VYHCSEALSHPELVSGSTVPLARAGWNAMEMLKRVQQDGVADLSYGALKAFPQSDEKRPARPIFGLSGADA
jgi:hypothetical protein